MYELKLTFFSDESSNSMGENFKKEGFVFWFFGPGFKRSITNVYAFSMLFAAVLCCMENTVSYPQSFSACTIFKFFIFSMNVTIA